MDARDRELLVEHDGDARRVRYARLVLATGARELFLPFPGWTLPAVVGVGGAQALLKAGGSFRGRRVLVAGSGPLLPAVAAALAAAGARIVGIAEQAPRGRLAAFGAGLWRAPGKIVEGLGYAARLAGVSYRTGSWLREVEARGGGLRATLGDGRRAWTVDCDVVACGFGLVPNLELPRLVGCEIADNRVVTRAAQETSVAGVYAAGELGGIAGVDHALVTGAIAGLAAAGRQVPRGAGAPRSARARLRPPPRARVRPARGAARPRRARHARVPLRRRRARPLRGQRVRARSQAPDARRHGSVSRPRLRSRARVPPRLAQRHAAAAARSHTARHADAGARAKGRGAAGSTMMSGPSHRTREIP